MGLLQIARSWATWVQGSDHTKALMDTRLKVCEECEFAGEALGIAYCMACTCPLAGKTAHPMNVCPKGKWGVAGEKQSFF